MTAPVAIALLGAVTSIAIALACVATLRARAARVELRARDRQHGESVELARKMEATSRLAGDVAHDVTGRRRHARDGRVRPVAEARKISPGVHVVFMSAFARDATRHLNADGFLAKPFTIESLTSIVEKALSR